MSVEVSILLGKANLAFVEKKYEEAIPVFEEIVRIEPMCRMAWNNLGAIYQDMGDFERSSQFRIIGAHLTAKSSDIWKELASESRQVVCLNHIVWFGIPSQSSHPSTQLDSMGYFHKPYTVTVKLSR